MLSSRTTAFVESAVNRVISKRMVKKQQMQWSKKGAHRTTCTAEAQRAAAPCR